MGGPVVLISSSIRSTSLSPVV
ncbi:BnaC08g21650D [Brassica napus]|uniref:BnaC08g21650D protein n=1 Tax=Brassica napus TaxID=3708 RepID=A0A078FY83_BRANA|nr:BnaC08g21650D [Brassica napus]